MNNKEIFAKRLLLELEKNQISQIEMAKKLKVSKQTVNKYVKAINYPDIENLIIISNFFGVSTDYLLGLVDE